MDPPQTQEEKMLGESIAKLWQSDIKDINNFFRNCKLVKVLIVI